MNLKMMVYFEISIQVINFLKDDFASSSKYTKILRKHSGSSINEKPNSAMSVMLCKEAILVKKNSCLVARIFLFDIVKS